MKHPDDNMDELFQRAASDYPLRESESSWDSIGARLQKSLASGKKNKGRRRYTVLVIIFLSALLLTGLLTQLTIDRKIKSPGQIR